MCVETKQLISKYEEIDEERQIDRQTDRQTDREETERDFRWLKDLDILAHDHGV